MSKLFIHLDRGGLNQLRNSPEMQSILTSMASERAARAGEGFGFEVRSGKERAYANIRAETKDAERKNQDNNILVKVISS